jgi:hypothetical protein
MADEVYSVVALPVFRSGTRDLEGYVPFVVRARDRQIKYFAIADGNNTGNNQYRAASAEEAMARYEAAQFINPDSSDPVARLVKRVPDSTAEAV